MTVRQSHIAFCTDDDRVSKHDKCEEPRTLNYTKLDVLRSTGGFIAVMVPYEVFAQMGTGPFNIFMSAARHGATMSWIGAEDSMPPMVERFFEMLDHDLRFDERPIFENDFARKMIIVSGIVGLGCRRGRAPWRQHIDSPEARRRRVAILAGEPHVSATQHRMIEAELRGITGANTRRRQHRLMDAQRRGLLRDLIP